MGDLDLKAYLAEEAEKDRRGDALKASMRRGMSRNPDEYAKALALAAQTGKAPEFVEQFRPEIEVEQALTSIEGLVMSHPKSAEWLANEQHASLAHDDLGSLRRLEEEVTSATSSLLKGVVSRGQQVVQGGLEVGELLAGSAHDILSPLLPGGSVDMAGQRLKERWSKPIGMGQSTAPMTTAFQARRKQTDQYFAETIKAAAPVTKADGSMDWAALNPVTNPRFYANLALQEGPMLLVQTAAGWRVYNAAVSNGASQAQATRLAAQVSARLEGTQIGAAEYVEAREKGMDPATAVLSASSKATLSVMVSSGIPGAKAWAARLEEQGVKGLRRRVAGIAAEGTEGLFFREAAKAGAMGGIRGRATRALLGSMTEGLEEWGQEEISMGVDRLYDSNAYQGAAGRRVTSFIGGAVLGGPMGALVGGPSTAAQEQALPGGQRGLQALSEVAATSKLAQRSPEKFAEFVGNLTAGTEQETVRMDARVFFQDLEAKGLDPLAVAQEMGAKNLEEALAAGTDLLVPTATYARALAERPGLAEVVTPIAKFRAQDMTAREMEAFTQEAVAEIKAKAQGEAGQVATEAAPDQALVQIREAIRSQLVEIGFEPTTADTNAMAMAKMVYTMTTRAGYDPVDYWKSWGVSIIRSGFGEGASRVDTILKQLQAQAPQVAEEGAPAPVVDPWAEGMLFQGPVDQPVPRGISFKALPREHQEMVTSAIEREIDAWDADPEAFFEAYDANPETHGGRLVNGDILYSMLPTVSQNLFLGHGAGEGVDLGKLGLLNTLRKRLVQRAIDKAGDLPVGITAGGQASGKTTTANWLLKSGAVGAVVDAPHDRAKDINDLIQQARSADKDAEVFFVVRPDLKASEFSNIKRAIREGRYVPPRWRGDTTAKVPGEILAVAAAHRNQPRVGLRVVVNREGAEPEVYGGRLHEGGKDAVQIIRDLESPTSETVAKSAAEAYSEYLKEVSNGNPDFPAIPEHLQRQIQGDAPGSIPAGSRGEEGFPEAGPGAELGTFEGVSGAQELGPIQQALQALGIDPAQVASGADLLAQVRQVAQARPEVAEVARDLERMLAGGDVLFQDYKDDMSFGSKAWQEFHLGRNKDGGRRLNDRARRARRALQQAKSQRADKAELDRRAEELRVAEEEFRQWEEGVKALQAADTLQSKAGFITLGNRDRVSIALLENANLSTFFHEFGGHLGLAMLEDLATREGASEQVKADWKAALDYLGVASGEDIQVEHHEKWARSMEAYLMEGKAPSEDLKGAFARIKEWMKLVYRQLTALGVKLTPEVRGVFDRMFASDAEIESARADLGETQALFATPEDMGVTPAEFALYSEARAKEIEAAKTLLEVRLFKELERERKDVWQAERDEVEAEIRAQLEQEPVYQAFDILAKGEMPDGTPLKLNKADLEAQIGKGEAKKLPRRFNRIYTRDGGVDLDTAAEFLGFESGSSLLDALMGMEPLKDVAAKMAEDEMYRRHGNMMLDGTITDAAQEALHNSHREEALALELQALRRLEREVRPFVAQARKEQRQAEREDRRQAREALKAIPPMETFRTSAREIVEGQRIRDLEPHRYLLAQRKHAREAFKAMKKRDYQAAADAKQKELLSHFLYLEALKAKEEADKVARYARKAEKTSFQAMLGKAGEEYQAQFNAMLDRYEFRAVTLKELDARSQNLAKFAEAQVANGEVIDFDPDLYLEQPKNYREMTLPELRAVKDALKNIETIARRQLEFVVAGKKMAREEIREAFTGWTPPEERTPVHLEGDRLRWTEKVGRAVRGLDAELLKVEWMVDRFDRGDINGPMRTYLKSLVDDADGRRQEMAFQMFKKIEALAKARDPQQVKRGDQLTKIRFPKRATPLTYDQLIAWALNLGTAENQKVAFLGEGLILGDGSLSPAVDQALSEIHSSDWAFIQGAWDALEELRAPLAAEHRRKTGLEMGLKELTPFSVTSSDGVKIDLRGGYYPLVASSVTNVGQTQADPLNTAGRGRNSRARVNTGMTKQVTGATYQLKLDYATVLSKHLHQTITNITFGETVEAVNWILGDEAIRNALSEKLGPEYVATLQGWVKDTIENPDDAPEQGAMIRGITRFKSGATIATLAGSIPSLAVQLSDWAKPIFAPGIRNGDLLKARYDLSLNYREIVEDIHRLSPNVMRHRAENFHRELRDLLQARNAFEGKNQATARFLMQAFSIMDAQVTLPAWLAVYRRGLQEHGIEAQAVAEADRFVSRTFQAGGPRDMSKLFRSRDGWARLFTTFQNDGNTWYGIISSAVASKKIGRISMALMGAFIGQALGQILKNRGWGDDDDEEGKKKWVVQQALLTGINLLPVVGSVVDGALGVTGFGGGGDYTTSAMVRTAKAFAKPFLKFEDMDWEEIVMSEAEAAGYAFGVPLTAQMIRTWKYTHKVREGEARPDGPADAAVDAVFGQNPREKR